MPPTPRPPQLSPLTSIPLFWQLQLAGWSILSLLTLPLKQAAVGSLESAWLFTACQLPLGLTLSTGLRYLYHWMQPARRPFIQAAVVVSAASLVACAIDVFVSISINEQLGISTPSLLIETGFYFFRASVYLIWSLGYFLVKALLLNREQAFHAAIADEKHRFELLRYQLNPNFLARTLATISGEIPHNPSAARAMTARLAEFYQNTLRHTDRGLDTTIGNEIALLRTYLEIERLRLSDCLRVRFEVDETLLAQPLPPILLLPLVEKAVKEVRGTATEPLEIVITVKRKADGQILLEVANSHQKHGTTPPFAEPAAEVVNLQASLDRYYPGQHRLAYTQDSLMARATLCLPPSAL